MVILSSIGLLSSSLLPPTLQPGTNSSWQPIPSILNDPNLKLFLMSALVEDRRVFEIKLVINLRFRHAFEECEYVPSSDAEIRKGIGQDQL